MRLKNKELLLIALVALISIAYVSPVSAVVVVPMRPLSDFKADKPVEKVERPSRYQQLLTKYLTYINDIDLKRKEDRIEDFKASLYLMDKSKRNTEGNEASILSKLRNQAKNSRNGKLDYEEDDWPWESIVPASAASARIFAALIKEDRVNALPVISSLYRKAYALSPAWVQVAKDVAAKNNPDTPTGRRAILVLYRAGVSRDAYQSVLAQMVTTKNDLDALDNLFFDIDKSTGERKANRSDLNMKLMTSLIGKKSDPDARILRAKYAAAIGNHSLAEATCIDLLSQKYKGLENVDAPAPKEDDSLGRAKSEAMHLLFYTIRSQNAFKQIYDESILPQTEIEEYNAGKKPKGWVNPYFYAAVRLDVGCAEALIGEIEHYVPGDK
jgi:hypothetical protein